MTKNIRIAVIGIALIGAVFYAVWWFQSYMRGSRASATAPTASFMIAGPKVEAGDAFDLTVQINPNLTPFFSFDVAFTYNPDKVSPKIVEGDLLANIIPLSTKPGSTTPDVVLLKGAGNTTVDLAAHTVRITALRSTGAGDPFTGRDIYNMATVSFVVKDGKAAPFDFKWIDPDPGKITTSDSFEKKDLHYTGNEPSPTPAPTGVGAIVVASPTPDPKVPTRIPIPAIIKCGFDVCKVGFFCYHPPVSNCTAGETCTNMFAEPYCKQKDGSLELTPTPPMGGSGVVASTTKIFEQADTLYINSIVSYPAPLRYQQSVKLEKGTYSLTMGARMYARRGTGLVLVVQCNEGSCGENDDKRPLHMNDVIYRTPTFPLKDEFSEVRQSFTVSDSISNKQLVVRVYCEDGSECDIDYITLEDAWGSERLKNNHFADSQMVADPRIQPVSWEVNSAANYYGSVDRAFGKNGALMINNSAK